MFLLLNIAFDDCTLKDSSGLVKMITEQNFGLYMAFLDVNIFVNNVHPDKTIVLRVVHLFKSSVSGRD